MNAPTDQRLLKDYAGSHSEAAFDELMRRHIDSALPPHNLAANGVPAAPVGWR